MAKKWNVEVTANPKFCGIDAGGVQFANGRAVVEDERLAKWFKKHEGYKVTEVKELAAAKKVPDKTGKKDDGGDGSAADSTQAPADDGNAGN